MLRRAAVRLQRGKKGKAGHTDDHSFKSEIGKEKRNKMQTGDQHGQVHTQPLHCGRPKK